MQISQFSQFVYTCAVSGLFFVKNALYFFRFFQRNPVPAGYKRADSAAGRRCAVWFHSLIFMHFCIFAYRAAAFLDKKRAEVVL